MIRTAWIHPSRPRSVSPLQPRAARRLLFNKLKTSKQLPALRLKGRSDPDGFAAGRTAPGPSPAFDGAGHGTAFTIADCFTSLGATNVPMDDWGVDVIGSGSQKGYVMLLGLSFAAMGERAWQARKHCDCRSSTWIYASTAKRPPPTATPLPPPSTST